MSVLLDNMDLKASTFMVPAVSAVTAGVATVFTDFSSSTFNIAGFSVPSALAIGVVVGLSTFIVQANSDYVLPMLGVTDPTTYNAIYIATPVVTGAAVVLIDGAINLMNGDSFTTMSSAISLFLIGAIGSVVGQWSNSSNLATTPMK